MAEATTTVGTVDFGSMYADTTVSSLRTTLGAADATAYSAANLNTMTVNDMVYAAKLVAQGAGWVTPHG